MKRILAIFSAAFALAGLTGAAQAQQGWSGSLSGSVEGPVEITDVVLGDELADRADLIGPSDLDRLLGDLRAETSAALSGAGLIANTADVNVRLVLADARPNRPTFHQLSGEGVFGAHDARRGQTRRSVNLSMDSVQLGRVKVIAEFSNDAGQSLGSLQYFYESFSLQDADGKGVWTDANRGIDRFARGLPGKVSGAGS